ncbi:MULTISPECIES: class I SAM-dependent methyltransferase [unclassified Paenibacillus]|uniref:class I SAM-dependent DNA methyltransferase n=1 Tax=unclassified Paenibacillus TaxID=185978 RepID=UPI001046C30A|nr:MULTISPECIES: class I SAM-dependent methyltransferase [unclassified Paenibacillus]NIK70951.1 putative AdoMet-dependent methyltransferase [Paenibacillus sp. BK720]TCM93072.1 putative AdoMet-dependent methyltransferase [Paenibacillus sp. BK033]
MGREFTALFDEWSESYDRTVAGEDVEYREVFAGYDRILEAVAERVSGTIVEFGVGTGNLTEKLLKRSDKVYGIEPSEGMRREVSKRGLPIRLLDGDFLEFPELPERIDAIVSTYAFHHLTDAEKDQAIALYSQLLAPGGRVVFADTSFANAEERHEIEQSALEAGFPNLYNDLRTEYYTSLDVLNKLFTNHGFTVGFTRLNRYVWLLEAVKLA